MPLLDKLRFHPMLSPYVMETCNDEGLCVTLDSGINPEDYVIIKVDGFYNGLNLGNTPPSPDCLIVLRCQSGGYSLHIVEFKDIQIAQRIKNKIENIEEKFNTCFNDFIKNRFKDFLYIEFKDIKLYFVSKVSVHKRDISLTMEVLMGLRIKYDSKSLMIRPSLPTPAIKKCY